MRWPLNNFWISQGYSASHQANDLAANQGDPIYAPEAGVVTAVNNNPASYFGGNYVKIRGDSGNVYYMGHNSKNYVSSGNRVTEGQHIADVGMTGEATGPHVHFQIEVGGKLLDPSTVLEATSKGGSTMAQNNLDTERQLEYSILGRDGRDGRPNAMSGASDADIVKFGRDKVELTVQLINGLFDSPEAQGNRKRIDAVYAERDALRKQVADLKEQLETVKASGVSAPTESDKKLQSIKDALGIK